MNADLNELASRSIQQIFRATPLLLAGSGFSCGYGLPGMAELGTHLVKTVEGRLSSDPARSLWRQALPAIQLNFEAGLTTIPSGAQGRDEVVQALREETANLIISRTKHAEDKILASVEDHAPVRLLKRLYSGAPQNADCVPVITTNYDTLIELFCDLAQLPLDTGFAGFRRRHARSGQIFQTQYRRLLAANRKSAVYEHRPCANIRLLKPHGSISWQTINGQPVEILDDSSHGTRAIVIPGPTKYEDALVNTLFDSMRSEMNALVAKAPALICLGFGFNDEHLQGAIRARLDSGMPAIILTRSFTDNINSVVARYPHIIAIQSDGSGGVVHIDGQTLQTPEPVWQLDTFLKIYLE